MGYSAVLHRSLHLRAPSFPPLIRDQSCALRHLQTHPVSFTTIGQSPPIPTCDILPPLVPRRRYRCSSTPHHRDETSASNRPGTTPLRPAPDSVLQAVGQTERRRRMLDHYAPGLARSVRIFDFERAFARLVSCEIHSFIKRSVSSQVVRLSYLTLIRHCPW